MTRFIVVRHGENASKIEGSDLTRFMGFLRSATVWQLLLGVIDDQLVGALAFGVRKIERMALIVHKIDGVIRLKIP